MMIFSRPMLLPLLALPILFCFWQWLQRGQPVVMPFDFSRQKRRIWLDWLIRCLGFLPAGLLAVALLLWAGPLIEGPPTYPEQVANIQICLDTSGSMNDAFSDRVRADGNRFTKYDAAMEAINEFTTYRQGDAFGFSIFTAKVIHWVPLTTDLSAIRLATPFVRPGLFPLHWWDGTKVGNAVVTCAELLEKRHEGDRMIIVLTDGESADLEKGAAQQIGQEMKAKKILVYAISIRNAAASEDLRTLCQTSGGQCFESGDSQTLSAVFRQIDQLQRAKLVSTQPQWLEFYRPFSILGLIFLGICQIAAFGLRFTPW